MKSEKGEDHSEPPPELELPRFMNPPTSAASSRAGLRFRAAALARERGLTEDELWRILSKTDGECTKADRAVQDKAEQCLRPYWNQTAFYFRTTYRPDPASFKNLLQKMKREFKDREHVGELMTQCCDAVESAFDVHTSYADAKAVINDHERAWRKARGLGPRQYVPDGHHTKDAELEALQGVNIGWLRAMTELWEDPVRFVNNPQNVSGSIPRNGYPNPPELALGAFVEWGKHAFLSNAVCSLFLQLPTATRCAVLHGFSDDEKPPVAAGRKKNDDHQLFHEVQGNLGHLDVNDLVRLLKGTRQSKKEPLCRSRNLPSILIEINRLMVRDNCKSESIRKRIYKGIKECSCLPLSGA